MGDFRVIKGEPKRCVICGGPMDGVPIHPCRRRCFRCARDRRNELARIYAGRGVPVHPGFAGEGE